MHGPAGLTGAAGRDGKDGKDGITWYYVMILGLLGAVVGSITSGVGEATAKALLGK